ncbi:putative membrane protein [Sinorhizobium fredii]|uniref:Putative membrane protein n=1 Tax=Sinorhizobium fredii (strain USDA 257) TaxID=1185652 RepID=I3XCS3_SINF2|nr:cytochrome c oxidase assembly protein [Sinorhizobium fredii]AFL53679.1 putative membrane protein [Sinorhizobium fredii USDA 257]
MGLLAIHMTMHILLMNLLAPLAAIATLRYGRERRQTTPGALGLATLAQLAALWGWHAPPLLDRAHESPAIHILMYASLFLTAFLFWRLVFRSNGEARWRPIVALLITSKFYCLLAVLFVFAPRVLYPNVAGAHSGHSAEALSATLADQQLAGLLMLAVCPATYVIAGIAIGARWLFAMETGEAHQRPKTGGEAWT